MKILPRFLLAVILMSAGVQGARADDVADSTLTQVGQQAPTLECTTLDGQKVSLSDLRGKVVLVNFFATWCGPCVAEMPELQQKVWERFKDRKFVMVAIGREHENKELVAFRKQHGLTFPMAGDPKRAIYAKYARAYIPRNYVIDATGKIAFQSVGYEAAALTKMVAVIQKELEKQN